MSHEIKFVSAEEAAKAAAKVKLTGEAIQPAKVRVDKTGGTGMRIEWKDGHVSEWTFPWLRWACPCATCHEEREADGREPGEAKREAPSMFPVYKEPVRPREVQPVGKYALRFVWNDGHEAGLYSWDYLRNVDGASGKQQTANSKS